MTKHRSNKNENKLLILDVLLEKTRCFLARKTNSDIFCQNVHKVKKAFDCLFYMHKVEKLCAYLIFCSQLPNVKFDLPICFANLLRLKKYEKSSKFNDFHDIFYAFW